MKILNYIEFKNESMNFGHTIPTYEECIEMCSAPDSPFYESKTEIDGYQISIFNYRLAQYSDFTTPIPSKPNVKGFEMRGLTFVFNKDGSVFKRFLLLEKFFNLNQTPDSMYSIVSKYKIKFVNNKEDGSIASFIQLPNGKVLGKSKMSFESDQAKYINNIYKSNENIRQFVDWTIKNDIVAIFEYVAPHNRIVLDYPNEELILLRLRDNQTGKHLDIRNYFDRLGTIKIAPFIDDFKNLDSLIELTAVETDKEGYIIQAEDSAGKDFFFKLKTPWYVSLHGLLTNDIYREHIIIENILEDRIDDVLGQIPETEIKVRERIFKIIAIVKKTLAEKVEKIDALYNEFIKMGSKKDFAIKYRGNPEFAIVMELAKKLDAESLTDEEILIKWQSREKYESYMKRLDKWELAKEWLRDSTRRLFMARDFLKKRDPELFFQEPDEELSEQ